MSVISLVVLLLILGVVFFIVETVLMIDVRFKRAIEAVLLLAACLYVLQVFGLISGHIRWT